MGARSLIIIAFAVQYIKCLHFKFGNGRASNELSK